MVVDEVYAPGGACLSFKAEQLDGCTRLARSRVSRRKEEQAFIPAACHDRVPVSISRKQ